MRLLSLLAVLLLAFLPLAGAQQGCGAEGCDPGQDRGDRPDPDAGDDGNETDDPDGNATDGNQTAPPRDRCTEHPEAPACRAAHARFREDADRAAADARYVSFEVDRENRTLRDYTVDGHLAFDAVRIEDPGNLTVDTRGAVLRIRTNASSLLLHDNPRGNVEYKSQNHTLVLDLPAGILDLDPHETERGHFLVIDYGSHVGKLAADRLTIEGDILRVTGHAAFHVQEKPQERVAATPAQQEVHDALETAEERRQLGARVAIRSGMGIAAAAMEDVEVTTYDDLDVNVSLPPVLGPNGTIEVTVSAELDEGRTLALELDPAVLDGLTIGNASGVAPQYFDLNDDGTWTEVVFHKAGSIQDILDATDDAGQPEYWIVEDEHGIQVLVSFPHWSTHRVSLHLVLEEIIDVVTQPSVLVGIVAGLGGVAVAAATLFLPRRREEEPY